MNMPYTACEAQRARVTPVASIVPDERRKRAALTQLATGRVIIVSNGESALFLAEAASITPDQVNLMATHGRGLVGIAMRPRRAAELGLSLQPRRGRSFTPLYTQSIEARYNVETGISTADRAQTILAAVAGDEAGIATPGHVFPYLAEGDPGCQADTALRLLAEAGCGDIAVTCAILREDGEDTIDHHALDDLAIRLNVVHYVLSGTV